MPNSVLGIKCSDMKDKEKHSILILDGMQIHRALKLDRALGCYVGSVNINDCKNELADHALVFFLRGISTNWKQIAGNFLNGAPINSKRLLQARSAC